MQLGNDMMINEGDDEWSVARKVNQGTKAGNKN